MKKEELSTKVTYIKCPDRDCQLWYDNKTRCEYDCPKRNELEKLIKNQITNKSFYNVRVMWRNCRLEHQCSDGRSLLMFEPGTIVITREDIT
jgi:hypothetical protein